MELAGSEYLYTFSLLALSFSALSVLVTVLRQINGGPLSRVDVYLVTTFTSASFAQCFAALLPPVVSLFGLTGQALWAVASGTAAILSGAVIARIQWDRSKTEMGSLRSSLLVVFVALWLSVLLLTVNALVPAVQGIGLHAVAVTLSLGTVMWSFVRRIASLGSHGALQVRTASE
jgi:hypothetical protein